VGDTNVDNVQLAVMPEFEIPARIEWDGQAPPAHEAKSYSIAVNRSGFRYGAGQPAVRKEPDGSFRIARLLPDQYTVWLSGSSMNAYIKSIRVGSREMQPPLADLRTGNDTLTVIASMSGAQIRGAVTDSKGPKARAAVALLDPLTLRTVRGTQSGPDGTYTIRAIPPGKYKLIAIEQQMMLGGSLPTVKDKAIDIELSDGAAATQDLMFVSQ